MKTILLSALTLFAAAATAQTIDTVSLGAGYANQTYYGIASGDETSSTKSDWDIAFETAGSGWSIRINEATGTELWSVSTDTTEFATIDTTGNFGTYTDLHNSDASWSLGAFAQNGDGNFDLGWGTYNMITHAVDGDEVFLIKLSDGSYQKVWIKSLAGGVYTFRHATLDNAMDMTHTLDKSTYSTKNFAYYSLQNHTAIDKEPAAGDWDLFFGQYADVNMGYYVTTTVQANVGVEVIQADAVDQATYTDYESHTFDSNIGIIGGDWKTYDWSLGYVITDDVVYFVKDQNGDIYKIVFTEFGGSANGNYIFTKEAIAYASVEEGNLEVLSVYPNPANDIVNIAYQSTEQTNYSLMNLSGQVVKSGNLDQGFNTATISVHDCAKGIYMLQLQMGNKLQTQKIIIQ